MEFTPEMFTGRKLKLHVYARGTGYERVQVDILPEEAIRLLKRIQRFRRRARREESLSRWIFEDREYRIGWKERARNVELSVQRAGIAWQFEASTEEGTETVRSQVLKREDLLAALLNAAHPAGFRQEFQRFADHDPEGALEALEGWLELECSGYYYDDLVPLEEEDLASILTAEDPEVRERAMAALPRVASEEEDGIESEAA